MRKRVFAAFAGSVIATIACASPSFTGSDTETAAHNQCIDDIEVLWAVADTYRADANAYKETVSAVLRQLDAGDPRRLRTLHLVALVESGNPFQRFATRAYADQMEQSCANPAQRFDPFNWNGKIPPGHAR